MTNITVYAAKIRPTVKKKLTYLIGFTVGYPNEFAFTLDTSVVTFGVIVARPLLVKCLECSEEMTGV